MCRTILVCLVALNCLNGPAEARSMLHLSHAGLPVSVTDDLGQQWMIYQGGWFQQQGNQPLYSQAAMLMVNGNQPNQNNNNARRDDETGEIIFDDLPAANVLVTRRILIDTEQGVARYVDIFRNTQSGDVEVSIQLQSNLNYGVNVFELVDDPENDKQQLGWVALTGAGRSVVEMFQGKDSPLAAQIIAPQGNSYVQANYQLKIPAGGQVALMHLHTSSAGQETGLEFLRSLDENKLMLSLPLPLRKLIVNFPQPQNMIGDHEILRGELLDVIELRGGDQLHGAIAESSYEIETLYGPLALDVDRVVAMVNVGQFQPRQLLVTVDGQVFGGALKKQTIDLTLSSGQVVQVPLRQISRMGYRKRAGEPEEWRFTRPFVSMLAGDRIATQPPDQPLEFFTRFGPLSVEPGMIHAIVFQTQQHGVHEVRLSDGSRIAGLLSAENFKLRLADADPVQHIEFPASSAAEIRFTESAAETLDSTPALHLTSGDLLVGALGGQLDLDTEFGAVAIDAAEIRQLTRAEGSTADVRIMLWDQTAVGGQLRQQAVQCQLQSGLNVSVPVSLLENYSHPRPRPSAGMIRRIEELVAQLNADDWKQRDHAEAQLISLGEPAIDVLRRMRSSQPPEAQQRIGNILKKLTAPEKEK